jgi:hypothetical protein
MMMVFVPEQIDGTAVTGTDRQEKVETIDL